MSFSLLNAFDPSLQIEPPSLLRNSPDVSPSIPSAITAISSGMSEQLAGPTTPRTPRQMTTSFSSTTPPRNLLTQRSPGTVLANELTTYLREPLDESTDLYNAHPLLDNPSVLATLMGHAQNMRSFTDAFLDKHSKPTFPDEDEKELVPSHDHPRPSVVIPKNIRVSDMVHEVRLPLHNIIGAIDTLPMFHPDSAERTKLLRILRTSYKHMQKILTKLSSKSDDMPLRIDLREPLVLRTLFETVEDLTAQIALLDRVNVRFETHGLSDEIFARQRFSGDINKLCEILITW
jgi:signal transduction histidine kinase